MAKVCSCPSCGGSEIRHRRVSACGETINLLPGAGSILHGPCFDVYVCGNCGNTQFFVPDDLLGDIRKKWPVVGTELPTRD